MASWDTGKPGDTDIVSQFPANERTARTAFQTNFGINHQSTDGADIGKHSTINLLNQGGDPSLVAGQGNIYAKNVAAQSELFWRATTGAAMQLTSTTGINPAVLTSVPAASLTGTIADARLSANVPLLNAANVFTNRVQTITATAVTSAIWNLNADSSSAYFGIADAASSVFVGDAAGMAVIGGNANVGLSADNVNIHHKFTASNATTTLNGVAVSDFARLSVMDSFTLGMRATGGNFAGAAGAGAEILIASSEAFFRGFDRTGAVYIPTHLTGSTISLQISGTDKFTIDAAGTILLNGVNATDFARLSQANTFTGSVNTFSASGGSARMSVVTTDAALSVIGFSTNGSVRGYVGADGGSQQITGGTAGDMDFIAQNGKLLFSGNGGTNQDMVVSHSGLGSSSINGVAFSDFARLSQSNTFTADQTVSKATAQFLLTTPSATQAKIRFETNSILRGFLLATGAAGDGVAGSAVGDMVVRADAGSVLITDGTNIGLSITSGGGIVTTRNASASEVGYKGLPQNSQAVSYTTVLADANKNLHQTGATKTFTIDSNANVAYPIGTALNFTCDNATGVSIAITTDTLRLAGTATTGTRTLAQYGVATAIKVLSTTWLISGAGLS